MAIVYSTVESLLDYLNGTISDVESFHVNKEELETDIKTAAAVKYFIQTAVESCANIAEHIIFGLNLDNPETTKELFPVLTKYKILDEALSKKLKDAVGLRNILVHMYREVDLSILADSATVGLNDLRAFAKAINEFLEKQRS